MRTDSLFNWCTERKKFWWFYLYQDVWVSEQEFCPENLIFCVLKAIHLPEKLTAYYFEEYKTSIIAKSGQNVTTFYNITLKSSIFVNVYPI